MKRRKGEEATAVAEDSNPYEAPKASKKPAKRQKKALADDDEIESAVFAIVAAFQRTRPWVSFFGILSYFGAGASVLGALLGVVAPSPSNLTGVGPFVFLFYLVVAVIYALLGQRLFRYREGIDSVLRSDGRLDSIATAVERQGEFWSLAGQTTIMFIGFTVLVVIAGVFIGVSSSR